MNYLNTVGKYVKMNFHHPVTRCRNPFVKRLLCTYIEIPLFWVVNKHPNQKSSKQSEHICLIKNICQLSSFLIPNPNYNLKHSNPYPINTYNGNNVATSFNLQPKPLAKLMIHELCPHILINNSQNTHKKKPPKKT